MRLIVNWKQCLNQGLLFGVLLTDLSKAFDSLLLELLAVKFNAFNF